MSFFSHLLGSKTAFRYMMIVAVSWLNDGWLLAVRSDYLYDGAICSYYLRHGLRPMELGMWLDLGLPINIYVMDLLHILSSPTMSYAVLTLLLFPLGACLIFAALKLFPQVDEQEAYWAGLFCACSPIVNMWPSIVFFTYVFFPCLFYLAWFCFVKALQSNSKTIYIVSLILLIPTFAVKSLLLFAPLLFFVSALYVRGNSVNRNEIIYAFKSSAFCFLSAAIFWVINNTLSPAQGFASKYNSIAVSRSSLKEGYFRLWQAFEQNFSAYFFQFDSKPINLLWLIIILGIPLILVALAIKQKANIKPIFVKCTLALCMLIVGAFPYISVSKFQDAIGYSSRHGLFTELSFSVLLAFFVHGCLGTASLKWANVAIRAWVYFFVFGCILLSSNRYQDWYMRTLQDEATLDYFKNHTELQQYSTFIMTSQFPLIEPPNRSYEYVPLLNDAWSHQKKWLYLYAVSPEERAQLEETKKLELNFEHYRPGSRLLENYNPMGSIATISVAMPVKAHEINKLRILFCAFSKNCRQPLLDQFEFNVTPG